MSSTTKSVLALAAATLAMFADVLFVPGAEILSHASADLASQYVHWRRFGFGELRGGNLALWNPHIYAGTPYLGGFQSALLYPLNWLHLVLPLNLAVNWGIALHVFLLGWFAFLWARFRGLGHAAATLSGLLLMFCGAHWFHLFAGHLSNLCTMVWAPLFFLAIDGLCRERSMKWTLVGALAVAMQVAAGHPQYLFYTSVAGSLYAGLQLAFGDGRARIAAGMVAMFAGGIALSAAQLLPGLDAASEAVRSTGTDFSFAATFSFPPENFLTLFAPGFFGDAIDRPYWGRTYLWEVSVFLGVTGVLLALVGAFFGDPKTRRFAVTLACATAVLALGAHTPLLEFLYDHVPGFDKFRGSAKFMFQSSVFWTALAGIGFDALQREGKLAKPAAPAAPAAIGAWVLAALCAVGALWVRGSGWADFVRGVRDDGLAAGEYYSASLFAEPGFIESTAGHAARSLWVAAAVAAILGGLFFFSRRRPQLLWVVLGLAALEVFVAARDARPTFDPVATRKADPFAGMPDIRDQRVLNPIEHNRALSEGTYDAWGYDPGVSLRYAELMSTTQGISPDQASQYVVFRQYPKLYEMLRIRYALLKQEDGWRGYEAEDPMGRVHLVHRASVIASRDASLRAMSQPDFDPRQVVLLEEAPPVPPAPALGPESVEIVETSTDHLVVHAELTSPAVLLITDAYAAGWRAEGLEGSAQPEYEVVPANYALMGVPLEAGSHRLRVEYRPTSFVLGAWISGVAWVLWLGLAVGAFRRSRA